MVRTVLGIPVWQLLKFGFVGGLATFVHATVGFLAAVLLDFGGGLANVVGFGFAWWVSFFGHYSITFERCANRGPALARFVVHSVVMFVIASAIATALSSVVMGVDDSLIPVLAACTVPVLSFISSKFFVFRSAV